VRLVVPFVILSRSLFRLVHILLKAMLTRVYDVTVAGAGAAGIATVGALLHFHKGIRIAWIDPDFGGGRIAKRYRDVSR